MFHYVALSIVFSASDDQTIADFCSQTFLCPASARLSHVLAILTRQRALSPANRATELVDRDPERDRVPDAPAHPNHFVLIDDQNHPLGCIPWRLLLTHLAPPADHHEPQGSSAHSISVGEWAEPYLEPIAGLPAHWSLSQFWAHLQTLATPPYQLTSIWGVIDPETATLLGLLDLPRVMLALAQQAPLPDTLYRPAEAGPSAELISAIAQFPFPLMLRTTAGTVITQNTAWQEQLAQFANPQALTQAAVDVLDAPSLDPVGARSNIIGAACQPGLTPDSCLCTSPTADGQERIWKFIQAPLPLATDGQTLEPQTAYALVMAVDVTDSQHLLQELQAKITDLTVSSHLKNDFFSEISHDIKNPLTAIVGLAHVLNHQGLGPLPARQAHYLQVIEQKSQQLMAIVNDLLDLNQIQTQQLILSPEPTSVRTLCEEAMAQAIALSPAGTDNPDHHRPLITLTIGPQVGEIVADPQRLKQILVYLLVNALTWAADSESIALQVEPWDQWMSFTVRNRTIRLAPEQHHLVFQLPQSEGATHANSSLNLILAQRLAQLHGGDLSFFVDRQQGGQMTLLIPSTWQTEPETPTAEANTAPPNTLTPLSNRLVLAVATHPPLLSNLQQQLTDLGCHMVVARSGAEALEKVHYLRPQAILLHLPLPLVSGWDVLTLLRRNADSQHCPIIVMGEPAQRAQVLQRGAQDFVSLPLSEQLLYHSLAAAIPQLQVTSSPPQPATAVGPLRSPLPSQSPPATLRTIVNLTVLHLEIDRPASIGTQIGQRLHLQGCRVISTDSLAEAELLGQIWKPNVVLYTGTSPDELKQLGADSSLLHLPFVILHADVADMARTIPELTVYGCSLFSETQISTIESEMAILIQVLKVAAGVD